MNRVRSAGTRDPTRGGVVTAGSVRNHLSILPPIAKDPHGSNGVSPLPPRSNGGTLGGMDVGRGRPLRVGWSGLRLDRAALAGLLVHQVFLGECRCVARSGGAWGE